MDLERFSSNAGPTLIGISIVGFILTRIIVWLPLGIVGSWLNGLLWPVILLALVAGIGLMVLRRKRNS